MSETLTGDVDLFAAPGTEEAVASDVEAASHVLDIEVDGTTVEAEMTADLSIRAKKFVFQALFEKASSVVPSKDIMPVLKNFQIEARPDRLRVVATDLELSVVSTTEMVETVRPGVAVFPAKKMLEIIRESEDAEMAIDVRSGVATVTVDQTTWTLKLQTGDDYPPLPDLAEMDFHVIDRVKFLGAIDAVRYAAATETTRPSLMMINVSGGKMTACDGVRFQQAMLGDDFPLDIQIPIGAVPDLAKLLRTTDLPDLGIAESDFHIVFRVGQDVFIANKLMATFPDVEQLLLQPALRNKEELLVDRAELAKAIRRVKINADPETSAIIIDLTENKATVRSRDKFGNACVEALDASWTSKDRSVVVNHKFLMEMLEMYDGKSCKFLLGDDTKSRKSPVMLRDDDTKTVGVIQQMRADWAVN